MDYCEIDYSEIDYSEIDNIFDDSSSDVGTRIRLHTEIKIKQFEIPDIIYEFDIFIIVEEMDSTNF